MGLGLGLAVGLGVIPHIQGQRRATPGTAHWPAQPGHAAYVSMQFVEAAALEVLRCVSLWGLGVEEGSGCKQQQQQQKKGVSRCGT